MEPLANKNRLPEYRPRYMELMELIKTSRLGQVHLLWGGGTQGLRVEKKHLVQ